MLLHVDVVADDLASDLCLGLVVAVAAIARSDAEKCTKKQKKKSPLTTFRSPFTYIDVCGQA